MFEQYIHVSLLFCELHREHSKTRCHDCKSMAYNATALRTNTHVCQYWFKSEY